MKNALNRLSTPRPSGEKGAAAVEFALVIFVLLLIVAGIVEFGLAFWYCDALTKATRDGARYISSADVATINTVGVPAARTLVVNAANAARVSPALGSGNVAVTCLDMNFAELSGGCQNNTAPANVRVAITNYSITLGGFLPLSYSGQASFAATLAPSTTMRYMN